MPSPQLFSDSFPESKSDSDLDALESQYPQYDRGYLCQSSIARQRKAREWMEGMWQRYAPYADGNFLKEFKAAFPQRAWELYLGASVLDRGLMLGAHKAKGPDLDVLSADGNNRITWIEAVSVTKGTGADSVPEMQYNGTVVDLPTEPMTLRITQALQMKHDQYLARLDDGTVSRDEPYVIAIDRSALDHLENMPLALRIAYGIGNQVLRIPVPQEGDSGGNWEHAESGYQRQEAVAKRNGQLITTTFFLNPVHDGISAIIYSNAGILNVPRKPGELGESLLIVHNSHARNPITGQLPFGEEWTGDESGAWKIREHADYEPPDPFDYLNE